VEITRTLVARAVSGVLLTAGLAAGGLAPPMLLASPASATGPCTATAAAPAVNCDVTGTLTLAGGALSATFPGALGWAGTISGNDLDISNALHSIEVDDLTGSGAGWRVTAEATTFTFTTADSTPKTYTLSDSGTLSVNGSVSNPDDTSDAPTSACASGSTCTVSATTTSFPVAITTAASPSTAKVIYNADNGTGMGKVVVGGNSTGDHPLSWWIHIPASAHAGTYTSTITLAVVSGP
jgi:hypothetical protein